ncbi:hypothetical protein [Aeromicrobium alkaliterrae]
MQQLIADGRPFVTDDGVMSPKQIRLALQSGTVRRLLRGVFVDARVPEDRDLRVLAVERIRPPHGVACSETAAWVMGLDVHPPGRRFDMTPTFLVPHGETRIVRSGIDCRQARLGSHDVTEDFGTFSTTPVRTASDLLRRQYRPYALASADQMTRSGLVDLGELSSVVMHLKGYPGIRQARSLVGLVDARAESPGESWTRLRLHDAGFPPPELQVEVADHDGVIRRIDLAYEVQKVAIEYDGSAHHSALSDLAWDEERRDDLSVQWGWRWVLARRSSIFGQDATFEEAVGAHLGLVPLRRWWGHL